MASDAGGLLLRCVDCPRAYCDDCCPDGFKAMPKGDPYLNALGWKKPSSVELIQCKICRDKENKVPPENTSGTPAEVSTMFYNRCVSCVPHRPLCVSAAPVSWRAQPLCLSLRLSYGGCRPGTSELSPFVIMSPRTTSWRFLSLSLSLSPPLPK